MSYEYHWPELTGDDRIRLPKRAHDDSRFLIMPYGATHPLSCFQETLANRTNEYRFATACVLGQAAGLGRMIGSAATWSAESLGGAPRKIYPGWLILFAGLLNHTQASDPEVIRMIQTFADRCLDDVRAAAMSVYALQDPELSAHERATNAFAWVYEQAPGVPLPVVMLPVDPDIPLPWKSIAARVKLCRRCVIHSRMNEQPQDLASVEIAPCGRVHLVMIGGSDGLADYEPDACIVALAFSDVTIAEASLLSYEGQRGFRRFGPGVAIPSKVEARDLISWTQIGTLAEWLEFLTLNEGYPGGLVSAVEGFVAGAFPRRYASFAEVVLGVPAVMADEYRKFARVVEDAQRSREDAHKRTDPPEQEPKTTVDPMRGMSAGERRRWLATHADLDSQIAGAVADDDSEEETSDPIPDARPTLESARFPEVKP